eukprot:TRINITY_DN3873_c3_g2_i1.p1 TRINITY_DN3873_c3_g2~~TRINITY_DN3873_c3_g2_i1.p1  ORF type:complete len:240 (-),score=45.74 TRINITY_DN3873_c3_g2_i1:124-843(-)
MTASRSSARRMALEELQNLHVPGYTLVKKLAHGAQGKVFVAVRGDNVVNVGDGIVEQVALKMYHGEEAQESFRREMRVLEALQGHYNIVRLHEGFEDKEGPVAVFELCKTDLHTYSSRRHLSEVDAVGIMRGVTHALGYVHALEIIHRDVKPENIAIASDDLARLIDFGIATWLSDTTELAKQYGTLGYMPPELFAGEQCRSPADVFALGATFYFILGKQYAIATPDKTYEYVAAKMKR